MQTPAFLQNLPPHWEVKRAKFLYREVDERSVTGDEELLSVSHLTGITPRSEKNVTMFMAESYVGHKLCRPKDLVINSMWAWMGALGVSDFTGIVSSAYGVYRPRNAALLPEFASYLLRMSEYAGEYLCRSKGIWTSRLLLNGSAFGDIPIPLPPLDEQRRIVAFIEDKTRAMDNYIAGKERVLELLRELQAATVARFVTRGLDDNAPRKDSGVAWLGEIPAHWNVKRLKYVAEIKYGDSLPDEKRAEGGLVFVYGSNGIVGQHDVSITKAPCIIIGRKGSFGKLNWSDRTCFPIDTTYFIDTARVNLRWLFYALQGVGLDEVSQDTGVPGLNRQDAYEKSLAVPPLSEQATIVSRIEAELSQIAVARVQLGREIELAREWRQSLIAEAVTGQLRV